MSFFNNKPPAEFVSAFDTFMELIHHQPFHLQAALDHLEAMRVSIPLAGIYLNHQSVLCSPLRRPHKLPLISYLVAHYEFLHCQKESRVFKTSQPDVSPNHFTHDDVFSLINALRMMGVDINAPSSEGLFAHLLATRCRDHDFLHFLLDSGADANLSYPSSRSCLEEATLAQDTQAIQTLLAYGADLNLQSVEPPIELPVFIAARNLNIELLDFLVSQGADLNLISLQHQYPILIHLAIHSWNRNYQIPQKLATMQWLLEHGADIGALDRKKRSALLYIAQHGPHELADCLVAYGAPINLSDAQGDTALHLASMNNFFRVTSFSFFELLLAHGGNLCAVNHKGQTPHDVAVACGQSSIASYLKASETALIEKTMLADILDPKHSSTAPIESMDTQSMTDSEAPHTPPMPRPSQPQTKRRSL